MNVRNKSKALAVLLVFCLVLSYSATPAVALGLLDIISLGSSSESTGTPDNGSTANTEENNKTDAETNNETSDEQNASGNTENNAETPENNDENAKNNRYSGRASARVLNLGAIPNILLDISAGKSYSWIDNANSPYSRGRATPLQVKLLSGNLLDGLLAVESESDQGANKGGIQPENLPPLLQDLGITAGLLTAEAYADMSPEANSRSTVASLKVGLPLNLLGLNGDLLQATLIDAQTSTKPKNSSAKVNPVDISLLGGLLEIEALTCSASATATGEKGGADASFDWSVVDIRLLGSSILAELKAEGKVELPGVLKIALGSSEVNVKADGSYASVSGSALVVEVLDLSSLSELLPVLDLSLAEGLLSGTAVRLAIGEVSAVSSTSAVPDDDEDIRKPEDPELPRTSAAADLLMLGLGAAILSSGLALSKNIKRK